MVRFSSHIYARLSVARQIHDHVDHQEAIQAYKAEMINYLLKKKSGTWKGEMDEDESGEAMVAGTGAAAQAIEDIPTPYRWLNLNTETLPWCAPGDKLTTDDAPVQFGRACVVSLWPWTLS